MQAEPSTLMAPLRPGQVKPYQPLGESRVEFDGAVHTDIVPNDGEWAAVVFYRSPDCVPSNFNLRQFFDFPFLDASGAFHPGFLQCPDLRIRRFEVWCTAPLADLAPMQAKFFGEGDVPIWFVRWSEFEAVARSGQLSLLDLENAALMPSLRKGSAYFYNETLNATDGASNPALVIVAAGLLEDGTSFNLKHVGNVGGRRSRISFGDYDSGPAEQMRIQAEVDRA